MDEKITKAKVQLILTQPFFATLALGLKFDEQPGIGTARTDGKRILFDPKFIEGLDVDRVKGLIAHEVSHVAYLHHTRRNGRDPEKWNIACDYAINQILIDSGFTLPEGGCIDKQYANMSAEEIYSKLPDQPKNKPKDGEDDQDGKTKAVDPGGNGGVADSEAKTESEVKQIEQEIKQLVAQAAQIAKQQGKMPAHLQALVDEILTPIVNWKDVLNVFLTQVARNDYTWTKPSKRYLSMGLYLPSLESVERGKFTLIEDTSGSVFSVTKLLNQFAGEMQSVLSECAESLTIIHVDTEVQHVEDFEADDTINLNPRGGGGTDFKPGFEYLEKNGHESACVIYFTDGECDSFPPDPGYPVLWAIYDNKDFAPPFGEVVHVN